jgi:hypothetical protein
MQVTDDLDALAPVAGVNAKRTIQIIDKVYSELPDAFSGEMVIDKILSETQDLHEVAVAAYMLGCKVTKNT